MMSSQISIIDQPHSMQLSVKFQGLLASLGTFQEHVIFIFSLLMHCTGGTRHTFGRTELTRQWCRSAETRSVEHDDSLPIIQLEKLNGEGNSCLVLKRCQFFPFP